MKKFMLSKKRNLSESSEDADDPSPVSGGYNPPGGGGYNPPGGGGGFNPLGEGGTFYRGSDFSTEGGFQGFSEVQGFKRPRMEPDGRRPSQTSTTSSVSGPDEDAGLDRDAASLSRALESTSSSDTEDDFQQQSFSTGGNFRNGTNSMSAQRTSYEEPKTNKSAGNYSSQAERMMSMMGYKSGTGLGKTKQGRVEPVGLSTQRGRRGLGHVIEGLESDDNLDWTPEDITVREPVSWMKTNQEPAPTYNEMRHWLVNGARNTDISGETRFCDPQVLKDVLGCKSVFDKLESHEMMKARSRSNPFETIAKGIFQNRAAMKMANMDAVFDYMFTNPKAEDGASLVLDGEPLYFADVCAGPGGFSEYVLWKNGWRAKGYGFTLRDGKHDFKLEDFFAGPPEGFEPYYGVDGVKGDGNVFSSENIEELRRFVLENTNKKGVHFMMADGGFSVEGNENIQEILSKQLYLCQFIVALGIVRDGGHFVCKLFDLFTPFSIGLVYLMYRAFEKVCIHKPNTSRPANSERYIICKWKRSDSSSIFDYLLQVNRILNELKFDISGHTKSDTDVLEIVPASMISEDREFLNYMVDSNNTIGRNQVTGLEKIAVFYRNRNLLERRQGDVKRESLQFWNVPDQGRIRPKFEEPQHLASRLLNNSSVVRQSESVISCEDDLKRHVKSAYDWRFVVIGTHVENNSADTKEIRTFLLSTGRQRVFYYHPNGHWKPVSTISSCKLELPTETLIYAELVWEMKGESKAQKKAMAVHVIDALFLAGEDVRSLHFTERFRHATLFLKVMNKPSRSDLVRMRMKTLFKLEDIISSNSVWNRLERKLLKGRGEALVLSNAELDSDGSYKFFQAKGLLFYKHVKDPFMMAMSKSAKRKYFFNTRTRKAVDDFRCPSESIAEFESCHTSRVAWYWNSSPGDGSNGITKEDLDEFVSAKLSGR